MILLPRLDKTLADGDRFELRAVYGDVEGTHVHTEIVWRFYNLVEGYVRESEAVRQSM